jgi:hypothetical protein
MKNSNLKLVYLAALVGVAVLGYTLKQPNINVRNNNPLNIKFSDANNWDGQTGSNGGFAVFNSPVYGFRAAYKLILLRRSEGRYSISKLVEKWSATDQAHYIDYLAEKLNKYSWTPIFESEIPELMLHMANFEGGKGSFTLEQINQGIELA